MIEQLQGALACRTCGFVAQNLVQAVEQWEAIEPERNEPGFTVVAGGPRAGWDRPRQRSRTYVRRWVSCAYGSRTPGVLARRVRGPCTAFVEPDPPDDTRPWGVDRRPAGLVDRRGPAL